MNHQLNNQPQVSAKKGFSTKLGIIFIVMIIVLGLVAFGGYRYWQSNQSKQAAISSEHYAELVAQLDENNPDSVKGLVDFAKQDETIYRVYADMKAAKFYIDTLKDYAGAIELLKDAANKTNVDSIQSLLNIRIARLYSQLTQYSESLSYLDKVKSNDYMPVINEIKGDVFVKMNRFTDAVIAYQTALTSVQLPEIIQNIKMKLNQAEYLKAKQIDEQEVRTEPDVKTVSKEKPIQK